MMAAELAHTLLSLGERLEDFQVDEVLADCMDKEDEEGFIPYERKYNFFQTILKIFQFARNMHNN